MDEVFVVIGQFAAMVSEITEAFHPFYGKVIWTVKTTHGLTFMFDTDPQLHVGDNIEVTCKKLEG